MTVLDFFGFFLGIISWKGALLFNGEDFLFKLGGGVGEGGAPWGDISFDGGFSKKKNHVMRGTLMLPMPPPPTPPHLPLWENLVLAIFSS